MRTLVSRAVAPPEMARVNSVLIRPIRTSDAASLERFYEALSEESRRTRFFAVTRGLTSRQSAAFCATDHACREGFVAIAGPDGAGARVVGHLCLEPGEDHGAEMAVAVADELQGRGIGRRLVEAGIVWARAVGIQRLSATMLATNTPIARLVASLGLPTTRHPDEPDVLTVAVELQPPGAPGLPRAA
jgi:GNAT superfamily N-acetyltransferase